MADKIGLYKLINQSKSDYEDLNNQINVLSEKRNILNGLRNFSRRNKLKIFSDSNDYFLLDRYDLVTDFLFRNHHYLDEKEIQRGSYKLHEFDEFFDFFFEIKHLDKIIPIFVRQEDFLKEDFNSIYKDIYRNYERDLDHYYARTKATIEVKHSFSVKKIIDYYSNKSVSQIVLKNLEKKILKIRKDNPEKNEIKRSNC